jgi:hypothetical protein
MKDRDEQKIEDLELLRQSQKEIEEMTSIPAGYYTINLSEKGKLGCAPATFHMKNFTTEGMIDLSMVQPEELPIKLADCLDDLIWEKDISIKDFNEKEVIETLLILYKTCYSSKIEGLEYTPTEEDWDYVAEINGGRDSDEFKRAERNLKAQAIKFTLDLNKVQFHELPDDFHPNIRVKKANGNTYKFGVPRYGDAIVVANYTKKRWEAQDKQFEPIGRMLKFREDNEKRWRNGENINLRSIPDVPQKDKDAYYEYSRKKTKDMMLCYKALQLLEVNGKDISKLPLDQKFEYANDPELDHITYQGVLDFFQNQKFGVDNEISITNPITGRPGKYNYPFRVDTLISAFYSGTTNTTTYEFE